MSYGLFHTYDTLCSQEAAHTIAGYAYARSSSQSQLRIDLSSTVAAVEGEHRAMLTGEYSLAKAQQIVRRFRIVFQRFISIFQFFQTIAVGALAPKTPFQEDHLIF